MTLKEKYEEVVKRSSEYNIKVVVFEYAPTLYAEPAVDYDKLNAVLKEVGLTFAQYGELYNQAKAEYYKKMLDVSSNGNEGVTVR